MSTKIVFPGTPVCVCIYPAERICSGWTDLESWLTAERLERLTRLPLLWTDRADVERDSRRGPDRFWSANPRYLHRANSITLPPVQTCFREHLSLSPSVCVACSSICRSEDTEADVSQVRTRINELSLWKDLRLPWQANSCCDFRPWSPLVFSKTVFTLDLTAWSKPELLS